MMMDALNSWWDELDFGLQIFYAIGATGSLILLMQIALMLVGIGDGDMNVDGDLDDVGDGGLQVVSVKSVVAFMTGFGWTGAICTQAGWHVFPTIAVAVVAGGVLMGSVFGVMRFFWGMRQSGTLDYSNAVGSSGTVYLPIPAENQGPGQVEVMIQGRLTVVEAFTQGSERLENQSKVKVVAMAGGNSVTVEPID